MIVLRGAREQVDFLQFSPDGQLLVARCPGAVQVWRDLAGGPSHTEVLPHRSVGLVRFTPDGRKLLFDGDPFRVIAHDLSV